MILFSLCLVVTGSFAEQIQAVEGGNSSKTKRDQPSFGEVKIYKDRAKKSKSSSICSCGISVDEQKIKKEKLGTEQKSQQPGEGKSVLSQNITLFGN